MLAMNTLTQNEELYSFTRKFITPELDNIIWLRERCYQVQPTLHEVSNRVSKALGKEPYALGTFLGTLKRNHFEPSVALIDIVATTTHRQAIIDEHAAWLFLCGRDVFGKSVKSCTVERGPVIVFNEQKEVLGYGNVVGSLSTGDNVAIKNLLDRGDFLRREMAKKQKKK